jgi:TetR/AcrR family transcriptional regulator
MMSKQKRDPKQTRQKITNSALKLFSNKGFDATSVDEIAHDCGVNKAMLYYYFKNKIGIYETAVNDLLFSVHDYIVNAERCCENAAGDLRAFIMTYTEFSQKHPYLPALLLRELSNASSKMPEEMLEGMIKLFSLLTDILERGEREGIFCDVKPMVIHFMITGTLNLLIVTEPLRKKVAEMTDKVDTGTEYSIEELAEYIFSKLQMMLEANE